MPTGIPKLVTSGQYKGQYIAEQADGSWELLPTPGKVKSLPEGLQLNEDDLTQRALKRAGVPETVHGDATADDPEILKQVAETSSPGVKSFLNARAKRIGRQTLVGVGADIAGMGLPRLLPPPMRGPVVDKLAGLLGGLWGGTTTSLGVGRLQGIENPSPFLESVENLALDAGIAGTIGAAKLAKGGKTKLTEFATKMAAKAGPLNKYSSDIVKDVAAFSEDYRMPNPLAGSINEGAIPLGAIGTKSKVALADAMLLSQNRAKRIAIPEPEIRLQENLNLAKTADDRRREVIKTYDVFKGQERAAHKHLESINDKDIQVVQIPQMPVQVMVGGVPTMYTPPPVERTYTAPIDITSVADWAVKLRDQLTKALTEGHLDDKTRAHVGQLEGMLNGIADAPKTSTGAKLMDYNDTKAIRNSLAYLISDFPDSHAQKPQMSGLARSIQGGLSDATHATALTWTPQRQLAYNEANKLTQRNTRMFESDYATDMLYDSQTKGVSGKGKDVDPEQVMLKALGSLNGFEQAILASGGKATRKLTSMFVKMGFDKALNKETGLYDGNKLSDYFINDIKNNSILESRYLLPEQRRVIKDFTRYMQRLSTITKETPQSGFDWKTTRIGSGMLSFAVGGAGYLGGGGMPMAARTGLGLAVAIPLSSGFIENILMNPEGGKLIQKMIYSHTTQQQMAAKSAILDKAIKNGVKVIIRTVTPGGDEEEKPKEIN